MRVVGPEQVEKVVGQLDLTILLAFALDDPDDHLIAVDIANLESALFLTFRPGAEPVRPILESAWGERDPLRYTIHRPTLFTQIGDRFLVSVGCALQRSLLTHCSSLLISAVVLP